MKVAIITVAGISSRFNDGVPEDEKQLKAIYTQGDEKNTLLHHLLSKCAYADKIIVVGGYKYDDLTQYISNLEERIKDKVITVYNEHFSDLSSGYSLYMGLKEVFKYDVEEVLFIEGDLDVDDESFNKVAKSNLNVLTYTNEPIYANKAVVLYKNDKEKYVYAFNSSHGLLTIDSPFSCILNSGQIWKFTDIVKLKNANEMFYEKAKDDTNLRIIQNYLDMDVDVELIGFNRWTNCNTKNDYKTIVSYWEEEK